MTHNEIVEMLEETNLPIAYDHFAEGESPDPPFICFLFPGSDNFSADGRVVSCWKSGGIPMCGVWSAAA